MLHATAVTDSLFLNRADTVQHMMICANLHKKFSDIYLQSQLRIENCIDVFISLKGGGMHPVAL
jgi:hypothetical protein